MKRKQPTRARGFFQVSNLAKAATQALRFAGEGGRLGTMLDVVDARLATTIGSTAWKRYWTTSSWELRGRSRSGVELLAVHHGGGPLGTPKGMIEAYAHSTREEAGARIPQQLFWDFLDGKFGPITTVELQPYLARYEFPFLGILTLDEALVDPVVHARLGPKAEALLRQHRTLASTFYAERGYDENGYLIGLESPSNCGYPYRELPEDMAFAHALVIGQPMNMSHMSDESGPNRRYWNSFTVELGCHERGNGVRMFGIRGSAPLDGDIQPETKRSEKRRRRVPKPKITVVDPKHPVDYTSPKTPPNYRCGTCGATGCKLWREYQTFLEHQTLSCARCAAESQGKDISDIDEHGRFTLDPKVFGVGQKSDQIGWRIPAVPTVENDTYWGYTSVPEAGCQWWRRLPTLPPTPSAAAAA